MKRRLLFLLIFVSMFLLTQAALSATWTDTRANNTFSFTGTTISTSKKLAGYGSESWHVTGYASISGNADPLGDDREYDAEMWLEASGKDAVGVPGRGNIDTSKDDDEYSTSTGKVGFAKGKVSSVTPTLITPGTHEVTSLSDSISHSWSDSSSSPSGLSVSPYCYGTGRGDIGKASGGGTVTGLTFRSVDNDADGETPDDGEEVLAAEICSRK